ncbi:MAG TPA: cyclopropane fatty acyl phospholipid synthase, partial [Vicinamibacterales bacterium]
MSQSHFVEKLPIGVDHPSPEYTARWARHQVNALLAPAGVVLDGGHPWDPQIHHPRALRRLLTSGTLGAGEGYMHGDWDCAALDEFTDRLLRANVDRHLSRRRFVTFVHYLVARVTNVQAAAHAQRDIRAHYDLGNQLYRAMLGPTMAYSCADWHTATTLDEAQDAKHRVACQKLGLVPGLRVLDIGCGWGGFARYAAEHYRAVVTGITLSPAQARLARARCAGLPVDIREEDYRDLSGTFDRIVSIGMFEHVGPRNYETFFEVVARCLEPDGLCLLHTIGGRTSAYTTDPWIDRYVFPGSVLPSVEEIAGAIDRLFVMEDWQNVGADYDRTLMAWDANLEAAWPTLEERYSER